MHPSIYAKRKAAAQARITERAGALVGQLELDPELAARLEPAGIREPQAADVARLEALADLMDKIAESAGAPAPPVTDVTVNKFIAPPPPPEPVQVQPPQPDQVEISGIDGLPAPTLEDQDVVPIEGEPDQNVIEGALPDLEENQAPSDPSDKAPVDELGKEIREAEAPIEEPDDQRPAADSRTKAPTGRTTRSTRTTKKK